MSTLLDIIKSSMRLIGAIEAGETPTDTEAQDVKAALNRMLDAWSVEKLNVFTMTNSLFDVVSGTGNYTIGTGQTWNAARPVRIESAFYRDGNYDYPLELITNQQYNRITNKTESGTPQKLYYKTDCPYAIVYLWPIPSKALKIGLQSWTSLAKYTGLTETIVLPEGYEAAIIYNLAIEISPEFTATPSEIVYNKANEYKAVLKSLHIEPLYLKNDVVNLGGNGARFDVYSGDYK